MKEYPYVPGWRLNKNSNKPRVKSSVLMLTKYGVAEGEWVGSEWVQYRWSCIVKDSDVLYWMHLEDLAQLEKEGQSLQQEQPEVEKDSRQEEFTPVKVKPTDAWEHKDTCYTHSLEIVGDPIEVPGFNDEFEILIRKK